jgi:hypothetical protein
VPKQRKTVSIVVAEEADGRFVITTYSDGKIARQQVVKTKPKRRPMRPWRRLGPRKAHDETGG